MLREWNAQQIVTWIIDYKIAQSIIGLLSSKKKKTSKEEHNKFKIKPQNKRIKAEKSDIANRKTILEFNESKL